MCSRASRSVAPPKTENLLRIDDGSANGETSPLARVDGMSASDQERPLRRDAQRSRRRVVDAAAELFAQHGLDVSFDEIARRAEVGVGTVYRRFPDRGDLIDAVFAEKVEELARTADDCLAMQDPWESIVHFCERTISEQQSDRGLMQVMVSGDRTQARLAEVRERVGATVEALVQRAKDAGVVRQDIEVTDIALVNHLASRLRLPEGPEVSRRYLALFVSALRPRVDDPVLPGPALSLEEFEQVAREL